MKQRDEEGSAIVQEILESEEKRERLASIYGFILECGEKRRARERESETPLSAPPQRSSL